MTAVERINDLIKRKEQFIATKESQLGKKVVELQLRLFEILITDLLSKLETENGLILNNVSNISLVMEVEKVFDNFSSLYHNEVIQSHAIELLKLTSLSATYYTDGLGIAKKRIDRIKKSASFIEKAIGIDRDGQLIKGSYLDSLSRLPEVRSQIKQHFLEGVTTRQPLNKFTKGFKELIVGNENVEGRLQRYYKQNVYDTFNNVDAIVNQHFAENLELKHFLYQGTLIKSSRAFCIKRAGHVFHVDDTKDWKNDPDLIDKKTKESYIPLIERGRYNCRHIIAYISEEIATEYFSYKRNKDQNV